MVLARKQTYRSMEQNTKPRNSPHLYSQLIYNKGGKSIQWGKDNLSNKWYWENWTVTCKTLTFLQHIQKYT